MIMTFCQNCGAPINGHYCAYCGASAPVSDHRRINEASSLQQKSRWNELCIAGFIPAVISLVVYGEIYGTIAIVVSIIGVVNANTNHEKGLLFGILGIVLGFLGWVSWFFLQ